MPKVIKQGAIKDKDFEAEFDVRTLADAEKIRADGKRFLKAQKASKKLMKEKAAEVAVLKKILGKSNGIQ
jgi:hypothetical protein|tara:strand:+ start:2389 stop:2598 length:210 start_codon:yes stop_codon:yes gene_type:complete